LLSCKVFGSFTLKDSSSPSAKWTGWSKVGQEGFGAGTLVLSCSHGCRGAQPCAWCLSWLLFNWMSLHACACHGQDGLQRVGGACAGCFVWCMADMSSGPHWLVYRMFYFSSSCLSFAPLKAPQVTTTHPAHVAKPLLIPCRLPVSLHSRRWSGWLGSGFLPVQPSLLLAAFCSAFWARTDKMWLRR